MLKLKFSTGFFESMLSRQHSLVSMEFCHFIFHFLGFVDFGSVPILAWVSCFGCVNSDYQQSNSFKTDATHPQDSARKYRIYFQKYRFWKKKLKFFLKFFREIFRNFFLMFFWLNNFKSQSNPFSYWYQNLHLK